MQELSWQEAVGQVELAGLDVGDQEKSAGQWHASGLGKEELWQEMECVNSVPITNLCLVLSPQQRFSLIIGRRSRKIGVELKFEDRDRDILEEVDGGGEQRGHDGTEREPISMVNLNEKP